MDLVIDDGEVFLGFIELHLHGIGRGIFLTVNHPHFQRHVGFSIGNGLGTGAQRLHGFDDGFDRGRSHLQAGGIFRGIDRFLAVGELAEAARHARRGNVVASGFRTLGNFHPYAAAHRLQHGIGVFKQERQGVDQKLLVRLGKSSTARSLHRPHLHHVHHFAFVAECTGGKKLHRDAAVGGFFQFILEKLHRLVAHTGGRLRMGKFEIEVGCKDRQGKGHAHNHRTNSFPKDSMHFSLLLFQYRQHS